MKTEGKSVSATQVVGLGTKWQAPCLMEGVKSALVTDDLASHRKVSEKLGLEHQVCQPVLDGQSRIPFATLGRPDPA